MDPGKNGLLNRNPVQNPEGLFLLFKAFNGLDDLPFKKENTPSKAARDRKGKSLD
jgi:hypothetical protein